MKVVKTCVRCISNTTLPGISFDSQGVCSYCKLHDKMDHTYALGDSNQRFFNQKIEKIRRAGEGKKYDCVLGISGGRDSSYTLYLAKTQWKLRPLAVHFNNGFGNPIAGENMAKAVKKLGVDLITISADWRECKDLKIAFLKASTPELEEGTDLGIAAALYGVAYKHQIKHILIGQSFRTEGMTPLPWNYLDGKYLKSVHQKFGSHPLRDWKPEDPGFNLSLFHMFYYTMICRIQTFLPLYYTNYIRKEADEIIQRELDWTYPGAHYFDDLYQSLIFYVYRRKFNIDRRLFNYSALIRSGQMDRAEALEKVKEPYHIEDPKVIELCIKRLGMTREELEQIIALPPKTFRDYPSHYTWIKNLRWVVKALSNLNMIPKVSYDKYFNCG